MIIFLSFVIIAGFLKFAAIGQGLALLGDLKNVRPAIEAQLKY
jgi:hypothetical protein